MPGLVSRGRAFNRTRRTYLATELAVADTHWSRLRGLVGTEAASFRAGCGLWIIPCRGVHTLAMSFPIDVVYLDGAQRVIHLEENVTPWRFAPVRLRANSVLELPSHTVKTSNTAVGDEIEIETAIAERLS